MNIQQNPFFKTQCFINGEWVSSDSGKTFAVDNPFDRSELAQVPLCGAAEAVRAIKAAEAALPAWRALSARERAVKLLRWNQLITEHSEFLATLITLECGKPIQEARTEVMYGNRFVEWFAAEARRVLGDFGMLDKPEQRMIVMKQPVGVVAAITPWNFPLAMITRKCSPALAAGCTVVIKPAEATPLTAFALAALSVEAGIPKGVINMLTGTPADIGQTFTASPIVRKISFTGSTAVGKLLMKQSSDTVKKVSMELGGNAPAIVFDDANLDRAVTEIIASKFRNSGQTCVCTNRVLVQASIYDRFAEKLTKAVQALKTGNGLEEATQVSALINQAGIDKVSSLVQEAVKQGARVHCGGAVDAKTPSIYQPTLLTGIQPSMRIFTQEIFGPVAALVSFQDEAEAIALANDTPFGLASYLFTENVGRMFRVSEALEYGMVGVNAGVISNEIAPFGGIKESGIGVEGSKYGIEEYLELKYVCLTL